MNDAVEEILRGAFDLHVHAGPDAGAERRMDALEVARCAYELEMGGFVLKSHEYNTAPLAYALNQMYPGLRVHGAVALNRAVGGVNPDAVEVAAGLGAQVVWMPTFDAEFWMRTRGGAAGSGGGGRAPVKVSADGGGLRDEVYQVLEVAAANDMTLASGHISPAEAIALFEAARALGVKRMIATHPYGIASGEELRRMAALGAHAEFTFLACMPGRRQMSPGELAAAARELGVGNCVVTTDFGQWMNPPPAEGMRMAIAALLEAGMTADETAALVKGNAAALVN